MSGHHPNSITAGIPPVIMRLPQSRYPAPQPPHLLPPQPVARATETPSRPMYLSSIPATPYYDPAQPHYPAQSSNFSIPYYLPTLPVSYAIHYAGSANFPQHSHYHPYLNEPAQYSGNYQPMKPMPVQPQMSIPRPPKVQTPHHKLSALKTELGECKKNLLLPAELSTIEDLKLRVTFFNTQLSTLQARSDLSLNDIAIFFQDDCHTLHLLSSDILKSLTNYQRYISLVHKLEDLQVSLGYTERPSQDATLVGTFTELEQLNIRFGRIKDGFYKLRLKLEQLPPPMLLDSATYTFPPETPTDAPLPFNAVASSASTSPTPPTFFRGSPSFNLNIWSADITSNTTPWDPSHLTPDDLSTPSPSKPCWGSSSEASPTHQTPHRLPFFMALTGHHPRDNSFLETLLSP